MATVTMKGNPVETVGNLPAVGSQAPAFTLAAADLSDKTLADFAGKRVLLNIFPSIDTPTCATSVRTFNERASQLKDVVVLCVAADLPFAMARFCGAEGIDNVMTASCFRSTFGTDYGVEFKAGPLKKLLSRAVVVIDAAGKVIYTEQVAEVASEPDYEAALKSLA